MNKIRKTSYGFLALALLLLAGAVARIAVGETRARYVTVAGWQVQLPEAAAIELYSDYLSKDGQRVLLMDQDPQNIRQLFIDFKAVGGSTAGKLVYEPVKNGEYLNIEPVNDYSQGSVVLTEDVTQTVCIRFVPTDLAKEPREDLVTVVYSVRLMDPVDEAVLMHATFQVSLLPVEAPAEDETVATEPSEEEGSETEPSEEEGSETEPSEEEGSETEPSEEEGSETEPSEEEGSETEPSEEEGSETEPSETGGKETEPSETEGKETEPSETQDNETDAGTPQAMAAEDNVTEPFVAGNRTVTEHLTTESNIPTEPSATGENAAGEAPAAEDEAPAEPPASGDGTGQVEPPQEEPETDPEVETKSLSSYIWFLNSFSPDSLWALSLDVPEGTTLVELTLNGQPFPAMTRYSEDGGANFTLLADGGPIRMIPDRNQLPIVLDMSGLDLQNLMENKFLSVQIHMENAGVWQGTEIINVGEQVMLPDASAIGYPAMITKNMPLKFNLPASWKDNHDTACSLRTEVKRLGADQTDTEAFMPVVTVTENELSLSARNQTKAGTYLLTLTWEYQQMTIAQREIVFFVNYTAYAQPENAAGSMAVDPPQTQGGNEP